MTPEEVVALGSMTDAERVAWFESKKGTLSTQDYVTLRGLNLGGSFTQMLTDPLAAAEEVRGLPDRLQQEAEQRSALSDQGSQIVAQAQSQGASPTQTAEALTAAGLDPNEFLDLTDPRWMLDAIGRPLTEDERQEFVELYNGTTGTEFRSFEELIATGAIVSPPGEVQQLVELAAGDREPFPSLTIRLAKGKTFSVASDEWESAAEKYGYDSDAMTRIVRLADANGMRGADNEYIAWQPLAALLKSSGWQQDQDRQTGKSQQYQALFNEIQELEKLQRAGAPEYTWSAIDAKKKQLAALGNSFGSGQPKTNPREIAQAFNEGLSKFDYDPGMAYIYAQDPGLAARIKATNGDRALLSGQDRALISRYVGNGGFKDADDFIVSMLQQGYAEADTSGSLVANYLKALELAGGGGGGGGRERILPDPVQVEQAAKDLYRSLFLEDPDEATLGSLTSMVSGAISSAPDNQNVDIEARIRDTLESSPQYDKYYGKKPGGMTEGEYRTQFGAAQQSILGAETAGNAAVRLGMQDGQYQTAVGAATGTKEAWNNSTWLGRLAQAANSVARNT